jgi:hypothetical protein
LQVCVLPGVWLVRASARRPRKALIREDLPTFERPMTASSGRIGVREKSAPGKLPT